jgi:uncharacterized membrane-anchored protein YitT (DUF2179 family)
MQYRKKILSYIVIVVTAFLYALNFAIFVFPNNFAPAGLSGLCTIFQHVTGLSMGYLNLLLNVPLAIAVFMKVSKTLAVRALTWVGLFSVFLIVLEEFDLSAVVYSTDNGTSIIIGPLVAGILSGAITSILLHAGTHQGGTQFIASLVHKSRPDFNFFWVTFFLNCVVAVASYFVYDFKIEPVLMCILYSFTSSSVTDRMVRNDRSAIRFEIVTKHPEELSRAIIDLLHHSATLIPGKGIYQDKEVSVLICVVNKSQAPLLTGLIQTIPETFAVSSMVSDVIGNFKRVDPHGKQEVSLLDEGEGAGI